MDVLQRIKDGNATCGVIGLGYVGLPLLVRLGRVGFTGVGIDVSAQRCASLMAGKSYVDDITSDEVAQMVAAGRLRATTDPAVIAELDTINICVPTPLAKTREPDMSFVLSALGMIAGHLRPGQLVVLESTTYPGTTDEIAVPALEKSGLKCGQDFHLAFSPERIDPGNVDFPLERIPKVVGGVTPRCTELATAFYSHLVERVVPVSSTRAAELTKLLENTFRIVNIGLANELALLADNLEVDIWEVIDAASTKPFGFMPFYPGPGLGGHCIPVDPFYLSWKVREHGQEAQFVELAGEINRRMPLFVVDKITLALNDLRQSVRGSRVLVLGVSYKRNVGDVRESAALDIIELLHKRGAEVSYCDPHVPALQFDGLSLTSAPLTQEALEASDCAVIVTDHAAFDYAQVVQYARCVVDTRNATRDVPDPEHKITTLGASRGSQKHPEA
jgi:UDP-N-acetyl-D-glucosamine dehydrogenase